MSQKQVYLPFSHPLKLSSEEMLVRSRSFLQFVESRRTVREYSSAEVDLEVMKNCIKAASTAPSGAHKQPWHFAVVSDAEIKTKIREGAESEEHEFYTHRAPPEWLEALRPFGTDENKPFLEVAPYLIAIFSKSYDLSPEGERIKNYYVQESVGIATGILITALHHCGLSTLTHTPSPMKFLNELLGRPKNEKPYILLIVGFPADDARVPVLERKALSQVATFV
jgi:nitroreductase